MAKLHVRKGDSVVITAGKDKGKKGSILQAIPKEGKVIVEGVNVIKRHSKPNKANPQGGIIEREAPVAASNAMPFCTKCNKGVRISKKILADGKKVRTCAICGEVFDK